MTPMALAEATGASPLRVGTAGWSIPRQCAARFGADGSALTRYAQVLRCAEINSTFYRSHRPSTYARWLESTPEDFRFSVKAPKTITHGGGLTSTPELLRAFLLEARQLGTRLGPILFQLPPRQALSAPEARAFFAMLRDLYPDSPVVLEPRHPSWYMPEGEALLREFRIARVIADPPPAPEAALPGGESSLVYYRLHGSPRVYYSSYPTPWLEDLAAAISKQKTAADVWCVFDNTASGAALENALTLMQIGDREG